MNTLPIHLENRSVKTIAKLTGMNGIEIEKTLNAIQKFTRAGFGKIRKAEREGQRDDQIELLNKFMRKMPKYKGEIYRVMSLSEASIQCFIEQLKNHNLSYTLEAMSSFTSDLKVAENYSGSCYPVILRVKKNQSGVSIQDFSAMYSECEVLVPKGTHYIVINLPEKIESGKINYIDLQEVSISDLDNRF